MTMPPPDHQPVPTAATDPITAILLAVTRIEGNLAGAIDTLKRHDGTIESHSTLLVDHGNRLVALETARAGDSDHADRQISARAVALTAAGVLVSVAAIAVTVLLAMHYGG